MSRKIIYHQAAVSQPQVVETPTKKEHNELADRIWAAVACGIAAGIFVLLLGSPLVASSAQLPFVYVGFAALLVGGCVCCILVFTWALATVCRPWQIENKEIGHRHALDLMDRETQDGIVTEQKEPPAPEYPSPSRLRTVALNILKRHFAGEKTTRDACTKAGICTQPEWNTVTAILLKAGLKKGYRLRAADNLADTWHIWKERVKFERTKAWVKEGRGSWIAVEFEEQ